MLLTAVALFGLVLPACGDDGDRLTIYAGTPKAILDPMLQRATKATGQEFDVRYGDSGALALRLVEEGDGTPADVFLSDSTGAIVDASGAGTLTALPAAITDAVDARFRSPRADWVGLAAHVRSVVHRAGVTVPPSILDLAKPAFDGRVALAPGVASFEDFVTALRKAEGDAGALAWLVAMKEHGAKTYGDEAAAARAVDRGTADVALVDDDVHALEVVEEADLAGTLGRFAPGDVGNLVLVTSAAVTAASDQQQLAQRFVGQLLSATGQGYLAEEALAHPLAAGARPAAGVRPLDLDDAPPVDLGGLGDLAATVRLIEQSGITGD